MRSQTITRGAQTWTQSYSYTDGLNRLTGASETGAGSWSQSYGFDAWGNRWVSASAGVPQYSFTPTASTNFDAANHLLIQSALYDPAGNQTQIAGYQAQYDGESRMTEVTINGVTATYGYDGEERRVTKTVGTQTTTYVYDAMGQVAAEYGPATDTGTKYVTEDHLGSTRLTTDTGGNAARCYDYLPYGEEIASGTAGRTGPCFGGATYPGSPDAVSDKFTGKERDTETGLDYFGARYFSAAQGRFTTPDWSDTPEPIPFADLTDPQTLNLYSYVRNNPLAKADADGHCPWCLGALIGFAGGGTASIISQKWSHPERDINWKQVGAAMLGGAVAGGTLGLATAPTALLTVLGGQTVIETGTSVGIAAAAGAGVAGGITERAVASGGNINAALGTPGQILVDAAVGAAVQGVAAAVVNPLVKQTTTAGRAVAVGEAKIEAGTKASPSLPQRQAQLSTQQQVASGALGAGVDTANRKAQQQQKKKPEDEQE